MKSLGLITLFIAVPRVLLHILINEAVKTLVHKNEYMDINVAKDTIIQVMDMLTPILIIISTILSFFVYYLVCKVQKEDMFDICNFSKISVTKTIALVIVGITMNLVLGLVASFVFRIGIFGKAQMEYSIILKERMNGDFLVDLITAGINAPFIEEMLFRGLIFKELKKNMSVVCAVIIQAILFSIYHRELIQSMGAFFAGVLLCLVYIWFKSIWAPVIIHMTHNLFVIIVSNIAGDRVMSSYIPYISSIILILTIVYIYKNRIVEDNIPMC
ncbi:Abortive infection protein [Alkaliphilus metalliredigens QYMF]|uniref:Abortive infection protein n=1 Tax=Alkaliphilus metalliredigens (strain QYMF) TaxID=293826 RepID=A6TM40_ALKMQ|nr:CPBP family intramembrane glutamic endopeptidase [Alkaliphilus metalliredigens]ABR47258.1 Abortive infection protein [Alkaliphilus metalliredigens QYMF]